jgi:hypothetical protein
MSYICWLHFISASGLEKVMRVGAKFVPNQTGIVDTCKRDIERMGSITPLSE